MESLLNKSGYIIRRLNNNITEKSLKNPTFTKNSALAGSDSTSRAQAETLKESGAAESFLWLLSFAEKESDNHLLGFSTILVLTKH